MPCVQAVAVCVPQALAEASDLGYAEADPTLDVGGFDARSKLLILVKLAFGLDVPESEIPVESR